MKDRERLGMAGDWPTVRLDDYVDASLGKMLDAKKNKGTPKPYLGNSNVRWGCFDLSDLALMKFEEDEDERYGIRDGDLIVCEGGEPGRCAIWREEIPDMKIQKALHRVRPKNGLNNHYLFYWLTLAGRTGRLEPYFTGTTIKHLTGQALSALELPLPSIEEQRAIADTLSALDAKIANNTKINHHLEQMAQAIFKSWFVDFEPFWGVMPDGWREGTISDIATDVVCGKTPSTKISEYFGDDVPFITIPDMHGRTYVTTTERSLSAAGAASQSSKTVPANSVCVSCIATAGLVVLTSKESQTNQQINTIVCKDGVSPFYIYLVMAGMADHIKMLGSSGSATNNLNKGQFSKIEILIPTKSALGEFSLLVSPIFEKIKHNQQESERLATLRDGLLPHLMSGELSVADLAAK